ncbi:group I intron-associated PD-(D/E)XK endonuclease [Halalkalibacterium halodurans]|uniref:group I intron-associated PD-(D/E)XK endonuclease n=1 Tax=Halalkalibacterium halodurans TaxID=86665 RepID=UPI002E1D23E8|nr:group I intron-associated PD-(D/E)XK endonuclease [Halalkalibacterium halodurans]
MAHETAKVGAVSEQLAVAILMANGWDVNIPVAVEAYDLIAEDPEDKRLKRIQVKTVKVRKDAGNKGQLVIKGVKSSGKVYREDEAQYLAGLYGTYLFLVPNTGQTEYAAKDATQACKKWRTLTLDKRN